MNGMLVLLNHLEDIESHWSELREIAKTHGIESISLARVLPAWGLRIRSRVPPHKLDMAAQMIDESAARYLARIARLLSSEGVRVEPIFGSILTTDVTKFIEQHDFQLIVKVGGSSELTRWSAKGIAGIRTVPM